MGKVLTVIVFIIAIIIFWNNILPMILAGGATAAQAAGEGNKAGCFMGIIFVALGVLLGLFMFGVI